MLAPERLATNRSGGWTAKIPSRESSSSRDAERLAINAGTPRLRNTLHFEPSARLQSILSRELVADPNVAVLEFVKNAYDAGARTVLLDFEIGGLPEEAVLIIADDGEGMDLASFQRNWMRPGFSEKAESGYMASRARVPAGEKGLGRLAAGRLGDFLDVYSRPDRRARWLHAEFDWANFEDMNQSLADIDIPIDDESEPDLTVAPSGTVVCITGLRVNWNAKVPGRKGPGRHPTRLGRLRQDLETLLLPLAATGDEFEIWINHDSTQPEDDPPGMVEPPFLDLIHYRYDFEVVRRGRGWQMKRTILRGAELLAEDVVQKQNLRPKDVDRVRLEAPPDGASLSDVGTFAGSFFYAPDSAERLRKLRAPVGVPLYRNGIRVEPYGRPGNDWLGAQARKASRQGYAAIQPAALYGAVRISRDENPKLRSQANREGLIENDAYLTFLQICRDEFTSFESIVFNEYLEPRWKTPAETRRTSAQATQNYALSLTRTLMHGINQPVATANANLDRLQTLITRDVDDTSLRAQLQELHDKTASQLGRIGEAIRRVLEVVDFDPTPERFGVGDLVLELLAERPDIEEQGMQLLVDVPANLDVEMPRPPVREAIIELVENAVQAPRGPGQEAQITITGTSDNGFVRLVVGDNGSGIDKSVRADLFKRPASTKGSIGMGLILIRNLLHLANADVELHEDGPAGARFLITLPAASS